MSVQGRVNHLFGGTQNIHAITITDTVASLRIPDEASVIYLTGSGTPVISSFDVPAHMRNRLFVFHNDGATSISVTHTSSPVAGQFYLGSSVTLTKYDTLFIWIRYDGVGVKASLGDN